MDQPKQKTKGKNRRFSIARPLEIVIILTHLTWLLLYLLLPDSTNGTLAGTAIIVVILTAIPFGPGAGALSGLFLASVAWMVPLFQARTSPISFGEVFQTIPASQWLNLAIWPCVGLAAGFYAIWFSRTNRHQTRKAWELTRLNGQLEHQIKSYADRLEQIQRSGRASVCFPADSNDPALSGALVRFLIDALTRKARSRPANYKATTTSAVLFEVITQNSPSTVAVLGPDGFIQHSHAHVLAMYGFDPQDIKPGSLFARLLTEESAQTLHAILAGDTTMGLNLEETVLQLTLPGDLLGKTLLSSQVVLSETSEQTGWLVKLHRSDLNFQQQLGWPKGEIPVDLASFMATEGCCLAPDGSIIYIDEDTAQKLGETADSLSGHKLTAFISNDSMEAYNQAVRELRNGQASRFDLILYPYGQKGNLYFHVQAFPSKNQAGNLVSMTLRLFDLTAKRQSEAMLSHRLEIEQMISQISSRFIAVRPEGLERDIQAVLRLVCEFENALECSIELVPSSYFRRRSSISYQNEKRLRDLQVARDSLAGDRFETIGVPVEIDAETVAYVRIKQDKYRDLWFDSDLKLIHLIGEIIVNAQIRSDNIRFIRLNERRLATTLHSIGEGVIATDPEDKIVLMNRTAERLTGWNFLAAQNLMLDQVFNPVKALVSEDDNQRWTISHLRPLTETDNSLLLVSRSGERFYISMTTTPIEDDKGRSFGRVTVFRDVTQSKRENDEIRYISYHDRLTGLYNRAFFEEEMVRLNTLRQYPITIIIGDCNGLKIANDIFGHLEGDRLLKAIAEIIRNATRHEDIAARWGGDEFAIILPQTDENSSRMICERILSLCASSTHQPISPSLSLGCATASGIDTDMSDLLKLAEDRMYRHKLTEAKSNRNNLIQSIEKMVFAKSSESEDHVSRLSELSRRFGQAIQLNQSELEELDMLSALHDVGKVGIPDMILNKEGPLNREEWEVVRKHPEKGYNLANSTPELKNIAEAILHHHERWDGTGYPSGLKGEEIPRLARILAIVDTFDVITHSRSYKRAQSAQTALQEIAQCAGSQFDPGLSQRFIALMQSEVLGDSQ